MDDNNFKICLAKHANTFAQPGWYKTLMQEKTVAG